jgi:hypothetical protein
LEAASTLSTFALCRSPATRLLIARALTIVTAVEAREIAWSTARRATSGHGLGNDALETMVLLDMPARISPDVRVK